MKTTDILRSEHEIILDVLGALESITRPAAADVALDLRSAQDVLDFLRNFCDRCHHGKEEQFFYPALAARGLPRDVGPLAVMASEHEAGRALVERMAEALAAAREQQPGAADRFRAAGTEYVALLRDHIGKENDVLFPMGDGMLSDTQQTALVAGLERFEHADVGAGTHERYLDLARGLCERLGLERAPRAAAEPHVCCGRGKCSS
jgi:hemerythrin-like domain-containing protein